MNRKELKKEAKKSLKQHYFRNVIFVFICTVLLGGGFSYTNSILDIETSNEQINELLNNSKLSNSEIINQIVEKTEIRQNIEKTIETKYYDGVISTIFNEATKSGSITFGILNGLNKLIFEEKIELTIIILMSNLVFFNISILFIKVLEIGKNRYFLEQRRYKDTKIDKLLFPYKIRRTIHLAYILFIKSLYEFLWTFTIVGIFIKHYEYSMIPYVLAENPNITKKEAFRLSKELTEGQKYNLFKLDLSLLGWSILNAFTFKLSGIFYSNIYKETLYAEVYMDLRNKKQKTLTDKKLLNDKYLDIKDCKDIQYPEEKFSIQVTKNNWLKIDYKKDYTLQTYILLFFSFAFIGWCWEVFYHLLNHGVFVNRGTLFGPWLPIYGWGGVLILFLLKRFRDNPFKLFISAFILCGIIEYATGWYLETFVHLKYWDYTGFFLNIHGRVCLEGLLLFGIGGCGFTYILAPILDNIYKKIKPKIKKSLCIILIILFIIDNIYSSYHPNTGEGITEEYQTLIDYKEKI